MTKLLIISHALVKESNRARWKHLARNYDYEVRILVPEFWKSEWFDDREPKTWSPEPVKKENYELVPVPTTDEKNWGKYLIKNLGKQYRNFSPDIIFCIQEEGIRVLHQAIIYRLLFAPRAKFVYFTMDVFPRVPKVDHTPRVILKLLYRKVLWANVRWGTDAAIGHYPSIKNQVRKEGYSKPFLMQTQIGINPELFRKDQEARERIRAEHDFEGFVVGFVGRLTKAKGVFDLLEALEGLEEEWQLLMVGNGDAKERIEAWVEKNHLEDRVKLPGRVDQTEVSDFMNAMDCLVLGSHTTESWIDTFPNVVPQAMATKTPVIGSDSGAIPYQLGDAGLVFPEKNVQELRKRISRLKNDHDFRKQVARKLYQRFNEVFSIQAINRQFDHFLKNEIVDK